MQLDLLGQKITARTEYGTEHEFTIDEVFPHQVKAYAICENGFKLCEAFSEGDLLLNGFLKSKVNHEYGKNFLNGWGL
jgi:hypothetical protein